ncbi:MAG TPA: hypothetical protein VLT33_35950, partial [Labilithrix sp.]|nr:hypothetical protein [Labilithrix sp.]
MRVRGPVVVLAAFGLSAAWLASAACSTFDAESPPADEAGGDSTTSDGEPPIDSSAQDAAPDGPASSFCSAQDAAFCADFEVPPLETGFNPGQFRDHGLLELTAEGHPSSPLHALRASAFRVADGGDAGDAGVYGAVITKDVLRLGAGGLRLELDVRIEALPEPTSFASVGGLDVTLGGVKNSVAIAVSAASGYVLVGRAAPAVGKDVFPFPLPAKKAWAHLRLDVDLAASTLTFYVDGTAAFAGKPAFAATAGIT